MTKKLKLLLICCVLTAGALSVNIGSSALAAGAGGAHVYEYVRSGIVLPIIHLEDGQSYKVEVFAEDDTEYLKPLELEDMFTFAPDATGNYRLRYLINDNGLESYRYETLRIEDTTTPTIEVKVKVQYSLGETVTLKPSISDNTAHIAVIKYELMYNGKLVSGVTAGGTYLADKAGEYKAKITVTDGGGNSAYKTVNFAVGETTAPEAKSKLPLIIGLSVGGGVLVIGGAVTAVLLFVKKKDKGGH